MENILDAFFGSCTYQWIYWGIALITSILWVIDYQKETKYEEEEKKEQQSCFVKSMWYFSDFFVSFVGWVSLYILLYDIKEEKFDSFNIFLATVAIISISGYGYKLFEKLKA
ncbi:hypothetical protein KKA17_00600 [bacterium]|nr:hypothetical protein [bacterium]MBU1884673.1 hypothetical protein [bacterium]